MATQFDFIPPEEMAKRLYGVHLQPWQAQIIRDFAGRPRKSPSEVRRW